MAEVQTTTVSGEMTLRFIEFVRMHSQNASFCLGLIPLPQTGKPQVNLPVARVLIEQLEAIAVKTRGNLSQEEQTVLNNAISTLQTAYRQAQSNTTSSGQPAV
jgi:hypothetical protein